MSNTIFNIRIPHRNWQEAVASLFALLIAATPGEIVMVTGPSRGGKTRLIDYVCELLFPDKSAFSGGKMPYVVVDAVNSGPNGSFSTKSFTLRMLEAIKHPFYSLDISDFDQITEYKLMKMDRSTEATLRIALERAFIFRGVLYLFIDEAQHASYATKGAMGAHAVLDSWKCFAKSTNIVLIIVGAYPILEIFQKSPHMLGRKHQVHLPRYYSTQEDIEEFLVIIAAYEKQLNRFGGSTDLQRHIRLLYAGSLGCIGLLSAWLTRAYAYAKALEIDIDEKLLLRVKLPDSDLTEISREIMKGEMILNETRARSNKNPIKNVNTKVAENVTVTTSATENETSKKVKNRLPFQRKPKRESPGNRIE